MIFDSLNISDNEQSNKKQNSQNLSLAPSNRMSSDDRLSGAVKTPLGFEDKGENELSFNEQLQVVTTSNDLIIEQKNIDEKMEDGNHLPFFDQSNESQEGNASEFNITKLNDATVNGVLNTMVNSGETNTDLSLIIEKEVAGQFNLGDKDIIIATNTIQKDEGLLVQNIALKAKVLDGEKLVDIDSSKSIFNRPVAERLNLDTLNKEKQATLSNVTLSEKIAGIANTHKYDVSNEGLQVKQIVDFELSSLAKTKEFSLGDSTQVNKFENGLQEFAVSKLTSLLDTVKMASNNVTSPTIPISDITSTLNPILKPLIEPSLMPEQIVFKQPLNTNSQFTNGLGVRIQWMLQQALSSAEIMLDPPELGPLNVKLVQAGSETNIVFQVNTLQGKEALEDNLAKLKEMLLAQGLTLGETEIQHKQKENEQQAQSEQESDSVLNEDDEINENGRLSSNIAILDTYI